MLQPARDQTEILAAALGLTALRLQLWANGYAPLPIEGKRTPLKKISGNLIAPKGGTDQKIELLADGQQVVVFGTHPNTDKPYSWFGGEPTSIKHEELPYVSEDEAKQFVADA